MLPKKLQRFAYAVVLMLLFVIGTTSLANTNMDLSTWVERTIYRITESKERLPQSKIQSETSLLSQKAELSLAEAAPMFSTIVTNADEVVACSNDGSTIARFNLCGNSDDRPISLSGSYSSYEWQVYNPSGSCNADINADCADGNNSCWSTVSTAANFNIDASSVSASNGAEFRVRVNGGAYYYIKVKKSTITQTFVKRDFICGVDGRIQITNLSSAYEYAIDSGSGFGAWQSSAIFDGLAPGTYVVKARLQNTPNTCEYPYDPIVIEQLDIDIDVTFTDAACYGETGSITVNVNNVPGPYKYTLLDASGVPQEFTTFIPNNPYTFAAVGFGTYSVRVETQQCTGDPANGIPAPTQSVDTGGNPIVIGDGITALSASTEVNNSLSADPTCGANDVDIIVRTSGGAAPYTYTVSDGGNSGGSYTTQNLYNVTTAGTYDFTITDANGCTITTRAVVQELTPPDVTVNGTNGSCSSGATLNIAIVDAKGYNLSFRATPADAWSNSPVLSVSDGTYNSIQVRYQQGAFDCIYTIPTTVTVTNVGAITGNAVKNQDRVCNGTGGVDGGEIEFVGPFSGGSGSGYEFSIDGVNFSSQQVYSNLSAGTYNPVIRDSGGCSLPITPITIDDVDPPTAISFAQANISCAAGTSDVQLTVTANAAITQYEVISPVSINNGASDTFVGLSTNTSYEFRVTDANGCQLTGFFTPAVISSIRARVRSGADTRVCTGATDGGGAFIIDGFANTYSYEINPGGITGGPQNNAEVVLPASGAGTYTITVTDTDSGCTDTASITIEEPAAPIALNGNVRDMSCANGNLGRVVANASGGWGGYRYTLTRPDGSTVGPKSGRTFGNLSQAGAYTLQVDDIEGCSATFNFSLTPLNAPSIGLDAAASDFCYVPGTGATIGVTATAGSAPAASFQYRVNGGTLQASPVFTGLAPGNYNIEVVDGNNCTDVVNVTVNPQLRVVTRVDAEIPCGGADGSIRVSASGGYLTGASKTYEVSSDNGATFGAPVAMTTNSFLYDTNVDGTYVFRITDNQGCTAVSNPLVLDPPANINPATATALSGSCSDLNNGTVTITPDATSGLPPYEISFNGGAFSSQTVYSGLTEGTTYSYTVRDARGCLTVPQNITVPLDGTPPDATVAPVAATCASGTVEGGIDVTGVTDGTADFTFIVRDASGVEVARSGPTSTFPVNFTGLAPGDYTVTTLDVNGCRDEDTVTITQTTVDVVPDPVPAPVCGPAGFSNTVEIVGGVGPFLIRLANDPNPPVSPNLTPVRHTFNNLQFGVAYTVEVTDTATGCVYLDEIPPINGPSPLDVTAVSTPGACDANRFGEIVYTVTGFNAGVDNLEISIIDNDTGTVTLVETVTPGADPYVNTYGALSGDYQILVNNLTDSCTDATGVVIDENLPAIDIIAEQPANCNADGQITVQGSGGSGGPYTFAFGSAGFTPDYTGTSTPADPSDDFGNQTTFVAPAGTYSVFVRDAAGCTSFAIATIISQDPPLPAPSILVDNQCDITAAIFQITVSTPASINTPRFTLGGVTQFGVLNGGGTAYEAHFTVNSPGSYPVHLEDANGCTSTGTAEVYEFLSASGGFTTQPSCNVNDGEIQISTTGGSGDFTFDLRDGATSMVIASNNTGVFTGYAPGDYEVLVTDNIVVDITGNCTFLVDGITLDAAVPPVIDTVNIQQISCNGANDGSIDVLLQAGTDVDAPVDYRLLNFDSRALISNNAGGSFPNLGPGRYDIEVVTARNCTVVYGLIEIIDPPAFAISAAAPDFACEPGANRYSSTIVTVTVDPGNPGTAVGGYQYSITGFENYQTANTFEIVDNGATQNITVYAIDGNGCQTTFSLPPLNPPTDVVPSLSLLSALTCAAPERVRVDVVGTTNFRVSAASGPAAVTPVNSGGSTFVTVELPVAGGYLLEVEDLTGGCIYPLPLHTVIDPISPTVVITEANPVRCAVPGNDGALFIEVTDYVGVYNYEVFQMDNLGNRVLPRVTSGSFDTANFPDVSGDPARITGLTGGNFIVDITTVVDPQCPATSNVTTVRAPNGALVPDAVAIGNVSCNNNTGVIAASLTGGWDLIPYEYRLLDGSGTEVRPWGNSERFENLSSGDYIVEYRDVEGCTINFNITLDAVPPIAVGIREPQALVCPGGNNAILEAYDPATGDAVTATPGASGGVTGAGYKYQLIYLGSNDVTDELSRSGLQDGPTFEGAANTGYISAGWYAIEVSSSYGCIGVSPPYYVDPPPAVIPNLVQVQAPGCGGLGQMRLSVENPEAGFEYEYRMVHPTPAATFTSMGVGNSSVLIDGGPNFYQFDIRKVNAANTCDVVTSNGLTLIDAQNLDLLVNSPDDISCASEIDGRIESFASGGIGSNQYFLYRGDPGDPFSPNATATLIMGPQDFGTFEGLDQADDYYVAVTSGSTCFDVDGPWEIVRPEPIVFNATPTPVGCDGEANGTITIEVTDGGEGLIQFAISPNFNDFFSDPDTPGTYVFEELEGGTYEILIQDEQGCSEKTFVTIEEPDELVISDVNTTPEICLGESNGSAQVIVQGGTPFEDPVTGATYYETMFIGPDSDGTETYERNDTLAFDMLQGGETYVLFVRDAQGCEANVSIPIDIGVNLAAEAQIDYGCEGIFPYSTTVIEMSDNSVGGLLFSLDVDDVAVATEQSTFGDLAAGEHTVYIYHPNGCNNSVSFTMEAYEPLVLEVEKTGPNEMTATASGGYGEYQFYFNGEYQGDNNVFNLNYDADVLISVIDAMGCQTQVMFPFDFDGKMEIPKFFTPDGDGLNDLWYVTNREMFPSIEVIIYDRYGRVVAHLDQVKKWDGTYEGKELPTGDYWYEVNANDREKQHYIGHFTLYR
ncbi:T9SS type B sorting domain-containing protein [Sediminicola luteus]|uniref:Transporter n=1 Tax=Sediminicola luteus TaxID=319238 RepID=A0A2A4GA02_9FLAO|nr:T9SS type B sorting domain-containing protein [Sediminicola luteus]PCE64816.1 transporter [Sediminicola luteus]